MTESESLEWSPDLTVGELAERLLHPERRLYWWGAALGISFILSIDPTGMMPIYLTILLVFSWEVSSHQYMRTWGTPKQEGGGHE